jgi:hypothetical protein
MKRKSKTSISEMVSPKQTLGLERKPDSQIVCVPTRKQLKKWLKFLNEPVDTGGCHCPKCGHKLHCDYY